MQLTVCKAASQGKLAELSWLLAYPHCLKSGHPDCSGTSFLAPPLETHSRYSSSSVKMFGDKNQLWWLLLRRTHKHLGWCSSCRLLAYSKQPNVIRKQARSCRLDHKHNTTVNCSEVNITPVQWKCGITAIKETELSSYVDKSIAVSIAAKWQNHSCNNMEMEM